MDKKEGACRERGLFTLVQRIRQGSRQPAAMPERVIPVDEEIWDDEDDWDDDDEDEFAEVLDVDDLLDDEE